MGKKWSESRPAEKLLSLYTLLLTASQPIRLTELSGFLNCAKQSVTRLIDQLESSHFGKIIRHQHGREVAYSLDRPARRPCLSLSADGLRQLALCRELLLHYLPASMHAVMRDSLNQAAALLPDTEHLPVGSIGGRLSKGNIDYTPFAATLDCLTEAMHARRVCTVSYRSARHRPEKRYQYAPLRLLAYRESLLVYGYVVTDTGPVECLFDEPTPLALQRITACETTGRGSAALPDIPLPTGDGLGIMETGEEPFALSVRFAPEAATYAAERQWSRDQRCESHEDGGITLHITANNEAECLSWVLGFGDRAEVLAPDWLRKEIKRTVYATARLYHSPRSASGDRDTDAVAAKQDTEMSRAAETAGAGPHKEGPQA